MLLITSIFHKGIRKKFVIAQRSTFQKYFSSFSFFKYNKPSKKKASIIKLKLKRARYFWKRYQKRLSFFNQGFSFSSNKGNLYNKTLNLKISKTSFFLRKHLSQVSVQKRRLLTYYLFAMRQQVSFYNTFVTLFGPLYMTTLKKMCKKYSSKRNLTYFRNLLPADLKLRFFQYVAYYFIGGSNKKKFSNFYTNLFLFQDVSSFSYFVNFSKVDFYLFYINKVKSLCTNLFIPSYNRSAFTLVSRNKKKLKRQLKYSSHLKSFYFLVSVLSKYRKSGKKKLLSLGIRQLLDYKKAQSFGYLKALNSLSLCSSYFNNSDLVSNSPVFFNVYESSAYKKSTFYGPLNSSAFYLLQELDYDYSSDYLLNYFMFARLSNKLSVLLAKRRLSSNVKSLFSYSSLEHYSIYSQLLSNNTDNILSILFSRSFKKKSKKLSTSPVFKLLRAKKVYFFEKLWKVYSSFCVSEDFVPLSKKEFKKYVQFSALGFSFGDSFRFPSKGLPASYKKFLFYLSSVHDDDTCVETEFDAKLVSSIFLNYIICVHGLRQLKFLNKYKFKKVLLSSYVPLEVSDDVEDSVEDSIIDSQYADIPSLFSSPRFLRKKQLKSVYDSFELVQSNLLSVGKNSLSKKRVINETRALSRTRNYLKAYFGKTTLPYFYNHSFAFVKLKSRSRFVRYSLKKKALKSSLKSSKSLFIRNFSPKYLSFFMKKRARSKLRYKFKLEQMFNVQPQKGPRKFFRFDNRNRPFQKKISFFTRLRKKFFLFRKRKYMFRYRWSIRRRYPVKVIAPKAKIIYFRFLNRVKRFPIRRKLVLTQGRKYVKNKKRFNPNKVIRFSKMNLVSFKPNWTNLQSSVLLPRRISFRQDEKKKVVNHLRRPFFTSLLRYQKHFRSFFYNLSLNQLKSTVRRAVRLYGRNFYNFLLVLERRLDNLLYRYSYVKNYEEAAALVKSGVVFVDNMVCLDKRKTVARNAVLQVVKPLSFVPLFNTHSLSFAHMLFILGIVSDYKSLRYLLRNRRFKTYFISSVVIPRYRESFILGEKLLFSRKNRYFLFSKIKYSLLSQSNNIVAYNNSAIVGSPLIFNSSSDKLTLVSNSSVGGGSASLFFMHSCFLFKRQFPVSKTYSLLGTFLNTNKHLPTSSSFTLFSLFLAQKSYYKKNIFLDCRKLLFSLLLNSLSMRHALYSKQVDLLKASSSLVVYNSFLRKDTPYRHVLYRESNSVVGRTVNYRNPKSMELRYPFPVILYFIYYYFRRYS